MLRTTLVVAAALAVVGTTGCSDPTPPSTPAGHTAPAATSAPPVTPDLTRKLADARAATAKYVNDLPAAQAAGYQIITKMMPNMGYHYLNPKVDAFDVTKPPILVYVKHGDGWQLGALEWVWPEQPTTAPFDGATYGSFDAACHYQDGTFVPAAAEADCAKTAPEGGAPFGFWHPKLTTLHVWLWYHNPDGLFHGTNPLVQG